MRALKLLSFTLLAGIYFTSCGNSNNTDNEVNVKDTVYIEKDSAQEFVEQSMDDNLAVKIKQFILKDYMTEADLQAISEEDRRFQFYKVDLNNDGKNEVFVNFITPYFCGTGGCTILLLDSDLKLISTFSPTKTLYIEEEMINGWRVILTKSDGKWRKMVFDDDTYPPNPTVVESTKEFPGENTEIMFDEKFSMPKTYDF